MAVLRWVLVEKWENQLPPLVGPPPPPETTVDTGRYTHRSIETLVVVLAAITIIAVAAGIIARFCGGRHLGDSDIEGWVEQRCRSCIDGGVAAPPAAPPAAEEPKPALRIAWWDLECSRWGMPYFVQQFGHACNFFQKDKARREKGPQKHPKLGL